MLSPSILRHALMQSKIKPSLRESLVKTFSFGSSEWPLLELVGRRLPCPRTRDPVLLALRRLAWQEVSELRAMHRVAVEQAEKRPFGFLYLVLEEVVALEHPKGPPLPQADPAFQTFFELSRTGETQEHQKAYFDLRARGIAEAVRRQITLRDPYFVAFLPLAESMAADGSGDVELEVFLLETIAMALESEGKVDQAIAIRMGGVLKLIEKESLVERLLDRVAEAMVDLADLMRGQGIETQEVEFFYSGAERLLKGIAPSLNLPLRRRRFGTAP